MSFINTLQNQRDLTAAQKKERADAYSENLRNAAAGILNNPDQPKYMRRIANNYIREANRVDSTSWFESPEAYKQSQPDSTPTGTYIPAVSGAPKELEDQETFIVYDPAARELARQQEAEGLPVDERQLYSGVVYNTRQNRAIAEEGRVLTAAQRQAAQPQTLDTTPQDPISRFQTFSAAAVERFNIKPGFFDEVTVTSGDTTITRSGLGEVSVTGGSTYFTGDTRFITPEIFQTTFETQRRTPFKDIVNKPYGVFSRPLTVVGAIKKNKQEEDLKKLTTGTIEARFTAETGVGKLVERIKEYQSFNIRSNLEFTKSVGRVIAAPVVSVVNEYKATVKSGQIPQTVRSELGITPRKTKTDFFTALTDPTFLPKGKTLFTAVGLTAITAGALPPVYTSPAILIPAATVTRFTTTGDYPTLTTLTADTVQVYGFRGINKAFQKFKEFRFNQKIKTPTGKEWTGNAETIVLKKQANNIVDVVNRLNQGVIKGQGSTIAKGNEVGFSMKRLITVDYLKPGFPIIERGTGAILPGRQTQLFPKNFDYLKPFTRGELIDTKAIGKIEYQYSIKDWQTQTMQQFLMSEFVPRGKIIPPSRVLNNVRPELTRPLVDYFPKITESGQSVNLGSGSFKGDFDVPRSINIPLTKKIAGVFKEGVLLPARFTTTAIGGSGSLKSPKTVTGGKSTGFFDTKTLIDANKVGAISGGDSAIKVGTGSATGSRSMFIVNLNQPSANINKIVPNLAKRGRQIYRPGTINRSFTESGTSIIQLPGSLQGITPTTRTPSRSRQRNIIIPRFDTPTSPPPTPNIPKPPKQPTPDDPTGFPLSFKRQKNLFKPLKRKKTKLFSRPFSYAPSFTAITLKKFGKKPTKLSGLELRPLQRNKRRSVF